MTTDKPQVAVVPCSGIGKSFGTVAREVGYELCDELRPDVAQPAPSGGLEVVGCSCGSGVPVTVLTIAGQSVEVVALPLILDKLLETHKSANEVAVQELMKMVRIYNGVAPEAEAAWRGVLVREFAAHCAREVSR